MPAPSPPANLESCSSSWPFAVVHLKGHAGDLNLVLAAAFCFDTPDGFAFIEPGYADQNGSGQHNFHRIVASLAPSEQGFTFVGLDWSGSVEQYEPTAQQIAAIGRSLEWLEAHLENLGINVEGERERIRALLLEALG